jgi:hypothetical protein
MHYKNGTPATAGDLVLHTENLGETSGQQIVGIVTSGQSQSTTCNGGISPVAMRTKSQLGWGPWTQTFGAPTNWTVTFSNCEKIDSAPVAEAAPEPAADAAENKEAVSAA